MKRTKSINLDAMRKHTSSFKLKPLALSVAVITSVAGCGSSPGGVSKGEIFQSLAECRAKYPEKASQCDMAYQEAQQAAQDSSPKYASKADCARDFGIEQCVTYRNDSGTNWFMPIMAGFIISELIDEVGDSFGRNHRRRSAPLFTSYSSSSPHYYRWTTADGYSYGNYRTGRVKLNRQTFKPKPKVTKTIKRGGFGSKVAAKSKWGGSKSKSYRSGWGG